MPLSQGLTSARPQAATLLSECVARLSSATSLERIMDIITASVRILVGADGATFVLRDGDLCYYAEEASIAPLWKGQRFPLERCVSGWSMLHRGTVVIRDIYADPRVPIDAYRPTYVKSLCIVPIRTARPLGAIGTYWSKERTPLPDEITILEMIANCASTAIENLELKQAIAARPLASEDDIERTLSSIAHDLRSPLSTMTGLADLLRIHLEDKVAEPARGYLRSISATGHFACRQMDRLLDLYRAKHHRLELETVDLTALATEIADTLRAITTTREIRFEAEAGLFALADPVLIRSVVENLISNAVKYSSKRPCSEIHFGKKEESNSETVYYVRDNGCGFRPEEARKLFKPMSRLHDDREYPGSGLGLVSVARIVELHGGRVSAAAELDRGATFSFSLPKVPAAQ